MTNSIQPRWVACLSSSESINSVPRSLSEISGRVSSTASAVLEDVTTFSAANRASLQGIVTIAVAIALYFVVQKVIDWLLTPASSPQDSFSIPNTNVTPRGTNVTPRDTNVTPRDTDVAPGNRAYVTPVNGAPLVAPAADQSSSVADRELQSLCTRAGSYVAVNESGEGIQRYTQWANDRQQRIERGDFSALNEEYTAEIPRLGRVPFHDEGAQDIDEVPTGIRHELAYLNLIDQLSRIKKNTPDLTWGTASTQENTLYRRASLLLEASEIFLGIPVASLDIEYAIAEVKKGVVEDLAIECLDIKINSTEHSNWLRSGQRAVRWTRAELPLNAEGQPEGESVEQWIAGLWVAPEIPEGAGEFERELGIKLQSLATELTHLDPRAEHLQEFSGSLLSKLKTKVITESFIDTACGLAEDRLNEEGRPPEENTLTEEDWNFVETQMRETYTSGSNILELRDAARRGILELGNVPQGVKDAKNRAEEALRPVKLRREAARTALEAIEAELAVAQAQVPVSETQVTELQTRRVEAQTRFDAESSIYRPLSMALSTAKMDLKREKLTRKQARENLANTYIFGLSVSDSQNMDADSTGGSTYSISYYDAMLKAKNSIRSINLSSSGEGVSKFLQSNHVDERCRQVILKNLTFEQIKELDPALKTKAYLCLLSNQRIQTNTSRLVQYSIASAADIPEAPELVTAEGAFSIPNFNRAFTRSRVVAHPGGHQIRANCVDRANPSEHFMSLFDGIHFINPFQRDLAAPYNERERYVAPFAVENFADYYPDCVVDPANPNALLREFFNEISFTPGQVGAIDTATLTIGERLCTIDMLRNSIEALSTHFYSSEVGDCYLKMLVQEIANKKVRIQELQNRGVWSVDEGEELQAKARQVNDTLIALAKMTLTDGIRREMSEVSQIGYMRNLYYNLKGETPEPGDMTASTFVDEGHTFKRKANLKRGLETFIRIGLGLRLTSEENVYASNFAHNVQWNTDMLKLMKHTLYYMSERRVRMAEIDGMIASNPASDHIEIRRERRKLEGEVTSNLIRMGIAGEHCGNRQIAILREIYADLKPVESVSTAASCGESSLADRLSQTYQQEKETVITQMASRVVAENETLSFRPTTALTATVLPGALPPIRSGSEEAYILGRGGVEAVRLPLVRRNTGESSGVERRIRELIASRVGITADSSTDPYAGMAISREYYSSPAHRHISQSSLTAEFFTHFQAVDIIAKLRELLNNPDDRTFFSASLPDGQTSLFRQWILENPSENFKNRGVEYLLSLYDLDGECQLWGMIEFLIGQGYLRLAEVA